MEERWYEADPADLELEAPIDELEAIEGDDDLGDAGGSRNGSSGEAGGGVLVAQS